MPATHPIEGYYSLIQYCPDRGRAEGVNVGVLLFAPTTGRLEVRKVRELRRLRRVFGRNGVDVRSAGHALTAFVNALQADVERGRFRTLQDLRSFIDTRADDFLLTTPKGARVEDHAADLDRLFSSYVATPADERQDRMYGARRFLHEAFTRLSASIPSVEVGYHLRVPDTDVSIRADYAYRNGKLNLVRCLDLEDGAGRVVAEALYVGSKNQMLQRHIAVNEQPSGLILVTIDGERTPIRQPVDRIERQVREVAEQSGARFVQSADIHAFVAEVEREAH